MFYQEKKFCVRKSKKNMLLIMTASVWRKTSCTFKFFYSCLPSMLQDLTVFILAILLYPQSKYDFISQIFTSLSSCHFLD